MTALEDIAQPFIDMAHQIVWASAATVDRKNRPRTRVLHPIWEWDGDQLRGWVGTMPTATKRTHLEHSPYLSVNYWASNQDTCLAECHTRWAFDDASCERLWKRFKEAPAPLGYDPGIVPIWAAPTDENFAVLELTPWKLRVFPGTMLLSGQGEVLEWEDRKAR